MKDGLFHFKRFSVAHSHSSMKVGVDAVLIGAWSDCIGAKILDVGTGCGVIALMMAQRNQYARLFAIDIDEKSIEEAAYNFSQSPWGDRLATSLQSFSFTIDIGDKFDRIISNPPYFDSGVRDFTSSRILARHQGELSPKILIDGAVKLLTDNGKLSMIVPAVFFDSLVEYGEKKGLYLSRACFVRGTPKKLPKRVMLEYDKATPAGSVNIETLSMYDNDGNFSEDYRSLGKDFYMKF